MATLSVYDADTFNTDMMTLSLAKGAEKYRDWQEHKNGADDFARLTIIIAMRAFLINEKQVPPETLTSVEAVRERYYSVSRYEEWTHEQRSAYITRDLRQSAFRYTIGTKLREFAVRHHAAGLTTAEVITLVLDAPQGAGLTPLRDYVRYLPLTRQDIRDYLSTQLNYLKRGQSRFPQKYIDLWEQSRDAHLQEIQHIPLTHLTEQVAALQEHYHKLLDAFNALPADPEYTRDRERLTNAMNKTMSGIYQMTRDPSYPKPLTLETRRTQTAIEETTDTGETE